MLDQIMSDYKGINLPKEMVDHIHSLIKKPKARKFGFKTPTEFVKDAVRAYIMKIENEIERLPLNVFDKKKEENEEQKEKSRMELAEEARKKQED